LTSKEFIAKKVKEISWNKFKLFPDDFLSGKEFSILQLPPGILIIRNEFFRLQEVFIVSGDTIFRKHFYIQLYKILIET
jgi:hypothetical protein